MDDVRNEVKISVKFRAGNESKNRVILRCVIILLLDNDNGICVGVNNKVLASIQEFMEIASHRRKIDDEHYIELMFIEYWLNL